METLIFRKNNMTVLLLYLDYVVYKTTRKVCHSQIKDAECTLKYITAHTVALESKNSDI